MMVVVEVVHSNGSGGVVVHGIDGSGRGGSWE